jgi:hypothetical protein
MPAILAACALNGKKKLEITPPMTRHVCIHPAGPPQWCPFCFCWRSVGLILVKFMYQFAIDMGEENSYSLAAPKGVNEKQIIENLAVSAQPSAFSPNKTRLQPSACLGLGLGHPWVDST